MAEDATANADRDDERLVPEWSLAADSQVIVAGLVVVVALLVALGWSAWQGTRQDPASVVPVDPGGSAVAPESVDLSDISGP